MPGVVISVISVVSVLEDSKEQFFFEKKSKRRMAFNFFS